MPSPPPKSAGPVAAEALVVDDHDPVLGDRTLCECQPGGTSIVVILRGLRGSAMSTMRRAARLPHMADIEDIAVDPDLAAAWAVDMADLLGVERRNQMHTPLLLKRLFDVRAAIGGATLLPEDQDQARRSSSPAWLRPQRL